MAFAITSDGHGLILHGELDMASERQFASAFDALLGSGAPVTVDMRQLRFIDSSGIKVIIAATQGRPGCVHHPARRARFCAEGRAHDTDR